MDEVNKLAIDPNPKIPQNNPQFKYNANINNPKKRQHPLDKAPSTKNIK